MSQLFYYPLILINYHVLILLTVGMPLILLSWAIIQKESCIVRLLMIYWKASSFLGSITLLMPDKCNATYLAGILADIIILLSLWFWMDLNYEFATFSRWGTLGFVVKSWRWALSFFCIVNGSLRATSIDCYWNNQIIPSCEPWIEIPRELYRFSFEAFNFIFGGYWTSTLGTFIGYTTLLIHIIYFIFWTVKTLPNRKRIAGRF